MSVNLNLKFTQSVIEGVLVKLAQTIEELFSRSETEAMGLEGFERKRPGTGLTIQHSQVILAFRPTAFGLLEGA